MLHRSAGFAGLCWTQLYLDQLTNKTAGLVLLYVSLILRPRQNHLQLSGGCFSHGKEHWLEKLSQTTQAHLKPLIMKDKALPIYQRFLHTWVFPTVLKEIISAYLLPFLQITVIDHGQVNQTLSIEDLRVNPFQFCRLYIVYCNYSTLPKLIQANTQANTQSYVPKKFHLQKWTVGQIWSRDHNLITSPISKTMKDMGTTPYPR